MKLALSTDFGGEHHWRRLVDFAKAHDAHHLVFWGDYARTRWTQPCLYGSRPGLLPEATRQRVEGVGRRMSQASSMTRQASMGFWYVYQVLMLPPADHVRKMLPELFNAHGEPDMGGELVYRLIREQLDEIAAVAPGLTGIETWIMECADFRIAQLRHQTIGVGEIIERIVGTIHDECRRRGWQLSLDLHTAGGDRQSLDAIFAAARRRGDVLVAADNVIGDFHLQLPFNEHLVRAAKTNPIQVHFDLNGEYWGRNLVPTSALNQYAEHIEIARSLGARYANGRVSTGHDTWSPHDNVLPSRRAFYPPLASIEAGKPLPNDIEVCCTDTLGGFNAEFFCGRVKDPAASARDSLDRFLAAAFGPKGARLAPVLERVEALAAKLYFTDKNYFVAQSVAQKPWLSTWLGLDIQMTSPAGTVLPTDELRRRTAEGKSAAFAGWPTPPGHRTSGPAAMIREKQDALAEATAILEAARQATTELAPQDRTFLVRQFEDLVYLARAFRWLLEAQVHHFMIKRGVALEGLPDAARLAAAIGEIHAVVNEWLARYPGDRYVLGSGLQLWLNELEGK